MVRFRTGGGTYAVPVELAREVRSADGLVALPSAGPGMAGMLRRGDEAVPVLDALGSGDAHVLVVESRGRVFGLLAEEVLGIDSLDEVAPPPPGQEHPLVAGVAQRPDGLVLLADLDALAQAFGL